MKKIKTYGKGRKPKRSTLSSRQWVWSFSNEITMPDALEDETSADRPALNLKKMNFGNCAQKHEKN